jgi:DamX protein
MDNFRWLEDKDTPKKHRWLKHYWMHIVAAVIIVLLLSYLIFGSGSSEPTVNEEPTIAMNTENTAPETTTKQITIRLPDQTTKTVNSEQPMLAQNNPYNAAPTEQNGVEPTTQANTEAEHPLSLKPLNEAAAPVTEQNNVEATTTPPVAAEEKPARVSTRLIQPEGTANNKQDLANIGVIAPKAPTETVVNTPKTVQGTSVLADELVNTTNTSTEPAIATQMPTQPETLTLTPPAQTTPAPATTNAPAATTTPATSTPPAQPPAATETTVAPSTSSTVNLHWILQRQPSHYTLQVFASHDEGAVQSFINQNNLNGKAVYAKTRQNNQDWYIVLLGDYATRDQAVGAITQLSANIQAQSPWARSMQSVQDAIRKRLAYGD